VTNKDAIDSLYQDTEAFTDAVHKELIALRGAFGQLTMQKFSQYPILRAMCGGNDLTDDYLIFRRELERIVAEANRNEAAAALSITAPEDLMLHRCWYVAEQFPLESGETRDQRTGRRWSDKGMRTVAMDLVRLAQMSGWMGREHVNIELSGDPDQFFLSIWHQFRDELNAKTPDLRILDFSREDGPKDELIDLKRFRWRDEHEDGDHIQQYRMQIILPRNLTHPEVTGTETFLTLAIHTPWTPMRSMLFVDKSNLGAQLRAAFTAYRGSIMIHLMRGESDSAALQLNALNLDV
jgi:hypothetical protein